MSLQDFKDMIAKQAFGMTTAEAHEKRICIDCKEDIDEIGFPTEEDEAEYRITGLCWRCFPEDVTK